MNIIKTEKYLINTETNEVFNIKSGLKLKIHKTQSGYLIFSGGKSIHRYVLTNTFIGPHRPTDEVDHIDGDILNNKPSNLRWLNSSLNKSKDYRHNVNIKLVDRIKLLNNEQLICIYNSIISELKERNVKN